MRTLHWHLDVGGCKYICQDDNCKLPHLSIKPYEEKRCLLKTQEINDLAFKYVEFNIVMNAKSIKNYFLNAGGTMEEIEFFMVFVKHWLDIKKLTSWQDIVTDMSFLQNQQSNS